MSAAAALFVSCAWPVPSGFTVHISWFPVLALTYAIFPFAPGNAAWATGGSAKAATNSATARTAGRIRRLILSPPASAARPWHAAWEAGLKPPLSKWTSHFPGTLYAGLMTRPLPRPTIPESAAQAAF